MKTRLTIVAVAVLCTAVSADTAWWNADFHYRVEATVNTLFQERQDAVVRVEVDFSDLLRQAGADGKLDVNSVRVVDPSRKEESVVPSKFLSEDGARGEVCWIVPGKLAPLTERTYRIYFDTDVNGPKKAPEEEEGLEEILSVGTNLIKNPGFEEPDPKNPKGAAHWDFGKEGPGDLVCRTEEEVHSGKYALKIVTTPEQLVKSVSQEVAAREGRKYLVRCWVKSPDYEKGAAGLWAWYRFDKPRHKEYGNYKTSAAGKVGPEWIQLSASWINVQIKETGEQRKIPALLPGTVGASICPSAYYGAMTVYLDDLEFIELPEKPTEPVEVTLGKPEMRKP